MITNFEELTVELTTEEKKLVPIIVDRFLKKPGRENMVSNPAMIEGIDRTYGIRLSEPRIRKIVQYIRINNLLPGLVGVSRGYFYTEDPEEIESWIESMKQRENAIASSRKIAEEHLRFLKSGIKGKQLDVFDYL
jgi:hypothetical protein